MSDLRLTKKITPSGFITYDIGFDENGEFNLTEGLETSMLMSVFCEQRDDSIELPEARGGWIGNELQDIQGFQQGSLIWTKYQSRLDEDVVNECIQIIQDGYQWMIDDNIASDVQVEASIEGVDKINVKVIITRNDDTEDVSFFDLWINTIRGN